MAKLQKPNPSFQKPQYLEHYVFLFTFPSMILWNRGLDVEFRRRGGKKYQGFPWRFEEEEGFLRERGYSRFGAKRGFNPYIKCSNKSTNQNKTRVQDF